MVASVRLAFALGATGRWYTRPPVGPVGSIVAGAWAPVMRIFIRDTIVGDVEIPGPLERALDLLGLSDPSTRPTPAQLKTFRKVAVQLRPPVRLPVHRRSNSPAQLHSGPFFGAPWRRNDSEREYAESYAIEPERNSQSCREDSWLEAFEEVTIGLAAPSGELPGGELQFVTDPKRVLHGTADCSRNQ
jgi:hypothetical protein